MYRVNITHIAGYAFKVKSKDYEFSVDIQGKGISPPDVLLASLGSCLGVYIRKYSEGAKLDLKDFSINVEAEFCKETPMHFKEINVSVDLKGIQLDEPRKIALLEFIKNCPIHNTLKSNPTIEIKIL